MLKKSTLNDKEYELLAKLLAGAFQIAHTKCMEELSKPKDAKDRDKIEEAMQARREVSMVIDSLEDEYIDAGYIYPFVDGYLTELEDMLGTLRSIRHKVGGDE